MYEKEKHLHFNLDLLEYTNQFAYTGLLAALSNIESGTVFVYLRKENKRLIMIKEVQDVKGECNIRLSIADDYGDNSATMRCSLSKDHEGSHIERYNSFGKKVTVSWEVIAKTPDDINDIIESIDFNIEHMISSLVVKDIQDAKEALGFAGELKKQLCDKIKEAERELIKWKQHESKNNENY